MSPARQKRKSHPDYPNFFLGGYISNLIDNPDKPYISIAMKSYDDKSSDTVFIMIFKQAGYGRNKYPNPTATIVKDAFEKQCPIACVYYNDGNGETRCPAATLISQRLAMQSKHKRPPQLKMPFVIQLPFLP